MSARIEICSLICKLGLGVFFLVSSQNLVGESIQYLYPASYQNPAMMQMTTINTHSSSGIFVINLNEKLKGTVLGVKGHVKSVNTPLYPYFLNSHRFTTRFVFGLDFSNPVIGQTTWPANGFQKAFGINSVIEAYEITPKVSINLHERFTIGASFRYLNIYNVRLDYSVLGRFVSTYAKSQSAGAAVGFLCELFSHIYFDFCWFTPIHAAVHGTSVSGTLVNTHLKSNKLVATPSTFSFNFARAFFNNKFMMSAKVFYSIWSPNKRLVLKNAVFSNPTILQLGWRNNVSLLVHARYQFVPKAAFLAVGGYDTSVASASNNHIFLPFNNLYTYGGGLEWQFAPRSWVRATVGQSCGDTPKLENVFYTATSTAKYTWGNLEMNVNF